MLGPELSLAIPHESNRTARMALTAMERKTVRVKFQLETKGKGNLQTACVMWGHTHTHTHMFGDTSRVKCPVSGTKSMFSLTQNR